MTEDEEIDKYFEDVSHWNYVLEKSNEYRDNWVCPICNKKYKEHEQPPMPKKVYNYYWWKQHDADVKEYQKRKLQEQKEINTITQKKTKIDKIDKAVEAYQNKKEKHLKI